MPLQSATHTYYHSQLRTHATVVWVVAINSTGTSVAGYDEIPERELVPGDVIVVPAHGCIMTCDAVLITGTCIVNESMLTGQGLMLMTVLMLRDVITVNNTHHSVST